MTDTSDVTVARHHEVMTPQNLADQAPAHHRAPAIAYRGGVPYYVGDQPQQITVNLPDQPTLSPWLRELIVITIVMLTILVVCTACIGGIVVLAGGTLMGIIGTVSAAALPVGLAAVGILAAAGFAATRIRALTTTRTTSRKEVTPR